MNSKRKGSLAIAEAIVFFVNNNYSVFIPVSDCDKYDLVVDREGILNRVQCKYSNDIGPGGGYIVDLRTFGGYREKTYHTKYKDGDFDLLFIYCGNKTRYLIPAEKVQKRSQIMIGNKSWNEYKC